MNPCNCYVCILQDVETNFQAQLAEAHGEYNTDWTFAKEALLRLKTHVLGADGSGKESHSTCSQIDNSTGRFWQIFDRMMTAFDRLNLQDTTLALDLLHQAHCFMINSDNNADFTFTAYFSNIKDYLIQGNVSLSKEDFQHLFKVTYSSQILENPEKYTSYLQQEVLWDCMKRGNENLLCGLLSYGVMFFPAPYLEATESKYGRHGNLVSYLLCARERDEVEINEDATLTDGDMPMYRFCLALRVMELFNLALNEKKAEGVSHETNRARLLRSAEGESTSSSVYFRCLRRVFDTIPEPHVTSEELRKLYVLFAPVTEQYFNGIIAKFAKMYPEAAGPLAPRSLQHLSRCQVRENLRQSGALPHGVKHLGLATLEKYILLEE